MPRQEDRPQPEVALPPTRPAGNEPHDGPRTATDYTLLDDSSSGPGQRFGRFEILDVLGSGGMGTVFEARDCTLDRAVALKLLHPDVTTGGERRVLREAKALAKLSHPHVVQIYEAGVVDGRPFIAMELVRGQTLAQWQAVPHDWRECVAVYLQAGRGLAAAHARDLVHRDFKPSNCILDAAGHVRVLDFGLAQHIESAVMNEARASRSSFEAFPSTGARRAQHTREHGAPGTLGYMPLEQLWGQPLDAKSDQFSFCVSLFESVYGRRPFSGESVDAMVFAMLDGAIDWPPGAATVPPRLRKLLARGLQAQPAGRWPDMDALLHELEQLASKSRRRWPRRRGWVLAGLGLGVIAAGAWWASREPPCPDPRLAIVDAWGPTARARVAATSEATGVDVTSEVLPQLDAYAERWAAFSHDVCTAERDERLDRATADLQRQCLTEAHDALEELATLLGDGGPRTLSEAMSWVMGLPSLAGCEDVALFVPQRPLPYDPGLAAQVRALRLTRAHVQSAHIEGNQARASELLEASLAQAEALGFVPLVAELELMRGNMWVEQGRYDDAELELERAYALALEHDHPKVALEAAIGLAYVVGDLREHHDAGFKWGLTAEAMARQPWSDPRRLSSVMEIMGNVLYEQGRLTEALERFQGALESRDRLEPDGPLAPFTLANIGLVLHEQGRYEDALPILYDVLERRRGELHSQHPALAVSLVSLGATLRRLGRHEEALASLLEALEIREQALGPESPGVVIVLNELGHLWLDMGELSQALDAHQRALAYGTHALDSNHSHVAEAWLGLGHVLMAHGLLDAAERHVSRAVSIYEQAVGPRHLRVGLALSTLGRIEHARGDREHAREHLELAVDILAHSEVPPAELATARFALARVLWSSRAEQQAALPLAELALGGYLTAGEPSRPQAAAVEAWLAVRRAR